MKKILFFLLLAIPAYAVVSFSNMDKAAFILPIEDNGYLFIRSDGRGDGFFAARRNGRRLHNGIDLLASVGADVLAPRSGRVVAAARNRGMGNYIIIKHGGHLATVYGHLSEIYVIKRQFVRQGQIIGRVGKTGNAKYSSIQPHLHFEVRDSGVPQDPLEYIQ